MPDYRHEGCDHTDTPLDDRGIALEQNAQALRDHVAEIGVGAVEFCAWVVVRKDGDGVTAKVQCSGRTMLALHGCAALAGVIDPMPAPVARLVDLMEAYGDALWMEGE